MNLDKASASSTSEVPAPPEWSMDVKRDGAQFIAEIKRSAVVMCRVSVVRPDDDEDAARAALADKARRWIHDY